MDTATRTRSHRINIILCLVLAAGILGSQHPAPAREPLVIHGANAAEERAIDWSIRRYREAGLEGMPDLEVYLHRSSEGCRDGIGYYLAGRIDLCTTASSEPYQRKFALHEMAHGWIETNVDGAVLERFMESAGSPPGTTGASTGSSGAPSRRPRSSPGGSARARSRRCSPTRSTTTSLPLSSSSSPVAVRSLRSTDASGDSNSRARTECSEVDPVAERREHATPDVR